MRFKGSASHNLLRRNPDARSKAASSSLLLNASSSSRVAAFENQTRAREPSRDSSTKLTRVPSRRGSVTSQSMMEFSSSRNSSSIRRARMPASRVALSCDLRCLPMKNIFQSSDARTSRLHALNTRGHATFAGAKSGEISRFLGLTRSTERALRGSQSSADHGDDHTVCKTDFHCLGHQHHLLSRARVRSPRPTI